MYRRFLTMLLLAGSFCVTSCIDSNYDVVNKKITTDVKIEGNVVALPVGSLKAVVLDSLVDVNGIEMLEKGTDGVYSIVVDSSFSIEESIDPIAFNIDPIEYNLSVDFDKVNVENMYVDARDIMPAKFSPSSIYIRDLNDSLPELKSHLTQSIDIPGLGGILEQLRNEPGTSYVYKFQEPLVVGTDRQVVDCIASYKLPYRVETVRSIRLGSEKDSKGTLVTVRVTNPKFLQSCDKEISLRIDFPKNFILASNDAAEQAGKYRVVNEGDIHYVYLSGFVPDGDVSLFSFYVTEIRGIDEYIKDGRIDWEQYVEYEIVYKVNGEMELTGSMKVEDFAFAVDVESQFSLLEVAGKTKDIEVAFEPARMEFGGSFDNLQHIDTINYVEFDETVSRIRLETNMDQDWLAAFKLKDGYAFKVTIPEQLDLSIEYSEYNGKGKEVVYDQEKHAFYVHDLSVLAEGYWELAPKKLTLNKPVVDDTCMLDVNVEIGFVNLENPEVYSDFYLAGCEMETMIETLDKLNNGDKEAHFRMLESDLIIKNAVVYTEVVHSSMDAETNFSINEKIPGEIGRVEHIGFEKDVMITVTMDVVGLEKVDTDINFDLNIAMPSFLELKPYDNEQGVDISDGHLSIKRNYNPSASEPVVLKLLCSGLDFMNEEFDFKGLLPNDSIDGNSYITYDSDVVVDGDASIYGMQFHSEVLNNDIYFNVNIEIDEIAVKTFHGLYRADIEGVDEVMDITLGEELEFLREEGNSITLADPQLEFVLTNPIGVPLDIALHVFGNDENGQVIAESEMEAKVSIKPAEYNEDTDELLPVETRLFLTADTSNISKTGYDNVQIPNLANLLKKIPHSVNLKVEPTIKTDVTHRVDISKPIKIDAACSVIVPLKFNDLHLCYSDTVRDLKNTFDETLKMFTNVSLCAKMDIVNTIPLGLLLKVVPLDENGDVIEGIEVDELKIEAGSGEDIVDGAGVLTENQCLQKFEFAIKGNIADILLLDQLAFSLEASSNHTIGTSALRGSQGIKVSNIVFDIVGDIEMDLNDFK